MLTSFCLFARDGGGQVELPEVIQAYSGRSTGKHIYAIRDGKSQRLGGAAAATGGGYKGML